IRNICRGTLSRSRRAVALRRAPAFPLAAQSTELRSNGCAASDRIVSWYRDLEMIRTVALIFSPFDFCTCATTPPIGRLPPLDDMPATAFVQRLRRVVARPRVIQVRLAHTQ